LIDPLKFNDGIGPVSVPVQNIAVRTDTLLLFRSYKVHVNESDADAFERLVSGMRDLSPKDFSCKVLPLGRTRKKEE